MHCSSDPERASLCRSPELILSKAAAKQDTDCPVKSAEQYKDVHLKEDASIARAANITEHQQIYSSLPEQSIQETLNSPNSQIEAQPSTSQHPLVGDRIKVFWPEEKEWFQGSVTGVNACRKCHISYDDGDTEWISLAEQKWEILPAKGRADRSFSFVA